ncbi:hypothetical protein CRUP_031585 [Coryphaenoides rupestris]|nr:hypothetical protein CRUP_031585 [Coryphaenoides rupestris]
MNWSFLESVLSGVNRYSTVIGRIWLSVLFLFRILVYVAAAEQVWKDEQKDFTCNTQQPGCENACYDHLFPVSQTRLWALQLIAVSTPSLLVALHVAYREHKEAKCGHRLYEDRGSIDGGLLCTYLASVFLKTFLEVGSLLLFYYLYSGFEVPLLNRCEVSPCPNTVDCYVAKATEKKVFLYIMGCTSVLCIALNVTELVYILWKQCWKFFNKRYVSVQEKEERRRRSRRNLQLVSSRSNLPVSHVNSKPASSSSAPNTESCRLKESCRLNEPMCTQSLPLLNNR